MQTISSLSVPPDSETVSRSLAWLESVAETQQWPARTHFKLRLCLDEVLTNLVMHGFQGEDSGAPPRIDLSVLTDENRVAIDVTDNGAAFDPTERPSAVLAESVDEATMGGHGLRLIRHYLTDMQYRRHQSKNHLRLLLAVDAGGQ